MGHRMGLAGALQRSGQVGLGFRAAGAWSKGTISPWGLTVWALAQCVAWAWRGEVSVFVGAAVWPLAVRVVALAGALARAAQVGLVFWAAGAWSKGQSFRE